jgi:hypothetical protein
MYSLLCPKKGIPSEKFQQPCGKANDLTIAQRQKYNGMSWSVSGSSAIAQIKVHFLNDSAIAA